MKVKVWSSGRSTLVVRIPKSVAEIMKIKEGDKLEMELASRRKILIRKDVRRDKNVKRKN